MKAYDILKNDKEKAFKTPKQNPNHTYFKTGMSGIVNKSNQNLPKIIP